MKKMMTGVLLLLFSISAYADYLRFQDMPLPEVAKLVSERTKYTLILPSTSSASTISFFKGDLSRVDFKSLLLGSLRISGFDYEIRGNQIFVKSDPEQRVFEDYFSRAYKIREKDLDLSSFLDDTGKVVKAGNIYLVYASPSQHSAIASFINVIDRQKKTVRTLLLEDFDESLIKSLEFGDSLQMVTDSKTRKIIIHGEKRDVDDAARVIQNLNRPQKTYRVDMLIASVNRQKMTRQGLGFAFSEGGFSVDLLTSVFSYSSLVSGSGFSAFAEFLETDAYSSIISRPFLQVRDGSSARLELGKEIPFIQSTVDQSTGQTIQNVVRKNVGLSINLSMTVISKHRISLKITQNLSNISNTQLPNVVDTVTDNQLIETQIIIKPGRIYSYGGLRDERNSDSSSLGILSFGDINDVDNREIVAFVSVSPVSTPSNSTESPWWD